MSEEALANRVAEIADSQQHIDTDFARSTNATGDLRDEASGIARAWREGREFGHDVAAVWAEAV